MFGIDVSRTCGPPGSLCAGRVVSAPAVGLRVAAGLWRPWAEYVQLCCSGPGRLLGLGEGVAPSQSPCALHVVSMEKLLWIAQAWYGVQGVPPDLRPEPALLLAPLVKDSWVRGREVGVCGLPEHEPLPLTEGG